MLHAKSTALEVVQSLKADLTGKTVLITGGTAGKSIDFEREKKTKKNILL